MTKKILAAVLTMLLVVAAAPAFAQAGFATVQGKVLDDYGKPMPDATIQLEGLDTGTKYSTKTNGKGEYVQVGVKPGNYKLTLLKGDKPIFAFNQVPITGRGNATDGSTRIDLDLKKERERAAKEGQQQMSEEEKKRIEEAQKENVKIKGLNEKLAQAKLAADAKNFDQAIAIMTETTQMDPNRDLLWAKLGDYQLAAKKFPEAEVSYAKATQLKPATAAYWNNYGQALAGARKYDEAVKAYDKAAQAEPANAAMYYFNEGAVLTNSGKVDEAIAAFDKVIAADPNRADAYYWKGVNLLGKATLDKSGKTVAPEGTAEAFNKYLELQPEGQFAQPSKDMLASMGEKVDTRYSRKGKK